MLTILIKAEAASKERHLDLSMPAIMVEEHLRQFFRMIEESENVPGNVLGNVLDNADEAN